MGTPIFGRPVINFRVVLTPDGRRAIVGGFAGELVGHDLTALTRPDEAGVEELLRRAEVISCLRVHENGQLVPLNPTEWLQRWNALGASP